MEVLFGGCRIVSGMMACVAVLAQYVFNGISPLGVATAGVAVALALLGPTPGPGRDGRAPFLALAALAAIVLAVADYLVFTNAASSHQGGYAWGVQVPYVLSVAVLGFAHARRWLYPDS